VLEQTFDRLSFDLCFLTSPLVPPKGLIRNNCVIHKNGSPISEGKTFRIKFGMKQTSGVIFLQRINDAKLNHARETRKNMTPAEHALWQELRRKKLDGLKFRRQQIIEGFIVDFFCQELKLVIEVDGDIHSTTKQSQIDKHRCNVFKQRGLTEIRFANNEILDRMSDVLEKIRCYKFSSHSKSMSTSLTGEVAQRAGEVRTK
jgi:very-short-patch-repair endonuclease